MTGLTMEAPAEERSRRSAFERLYGVAIALKGVDGFLELLAGLALAFAPDLVHSGLHGSAVEASEGSAPLRSFLADELFRADQWVSGPAVTGVVLILLVHGVVKLVTVTCLWRRWLAAYPWALAVLGALLVWQVGVAITAPSLGAIAFAVLDVVVIALVAREWRLLRARVQAER